MSRKCSISRVESACEKIRYHVSYARICEYIEFKVLQLPNFYKQYNIHHIVLIE
jgi:hypothetical protein